MAAGRRLGGFGGGLGVKRALLALEGHDVVGPDGSRWSVARIVRAGTNEAGG